VKIKQSPDDFRVEELTALEPSDGPFALYRLRKRSWTTHDVLHAICRLWQIPRYRLSYGGLKDRHADTTQHLTIEHGPPRDLHGSGWNLTYLGQTSRPFTSADIRANRFEIVIRALSEQQTSAATTAIPLVANEGVVNYFDDQRFGSVCPDGDFVARHMVRGDWEGALRLALAAPYEFDRAADKAIKSTLRQFWGDWSKAKEHLPRCHARSLVDYLSSHPNDFRGAVARLRPDLLSLYLSSYQSYLWNQMVSHWLRTHIPADHLVRVRFKRLQLPMPVRLSPQQRDDLSTKTFPLPSARLQPTENLPEAVRDWADSVRAVLSQENMEWKQLALRGLRRPFFSKGCRSLIVRPEPLVSDAVPDDRHPGRFQLRLRFELPRGSYATLLIKRLLHVDTTPSEASP
jgi:tRNA pseudouridine13 synthase